MLKTMGESCVDGTQSFLYYDQHMVGWRLYDSWPLITQNIVSCVEILKNKI